MRFHPAVFLSHRRYIGFIAEVQHQYNVAHEWGHPDLKYPLRGSLSGPAAGSNDRVRRLYPLTMERLQGYNNQHVLHLSDLQVADCCL